MSMNQSSIGPLATVPGSDIRRSHQKLHKRKVELLLKDQRVAVDIQ